MEFPDNEEVEISNDNYSAAAIIFLPTAKKYSWVLYYDINNERYPIKPYTISGNIIYWNDKELAIKDLKIQLGESRG